MTDKTGVVAEDTGSDQLGVTLKAADGRNIEVTFETTSIADDFGNRIGMREGVQSSTISLESKIPNAVVLTSSAVGDISRVGLLEGNYSKNQAVLNTKARELLGWQPRTSLRAGVVATAEFLRERLPTLRRGMVA
jgi:flagellin